MVPVAAEILTEEVSSDSRTAVRRSMRLGVRAQASGQVAMALILDMSETGMLLETAVPLSVGEMLHVNIPEGSTAIARVVWRVQLRAGCEFVEGFSRAALSASLLASSPPDIGAPPTSSPEQPATYDEAREEASIRAVLIILCSVTFLALLVLIAAVLPTL